MPCQTSLAGYLDMLKPGIPEELISGGAFSDIRNLARGVPGALAFSTFGFECSLAMLPLPRHPSKPSRKPSTRCMRAILCGPFITSNWCSRGLSLRPMLSFVETYGPRKARVVSKESTERMAGPGKEWLA